MVREGVLMMLDANLVSLDVNSICSRAVQRVKAPVFTVLQVSGSTTFFIVLLSMKALAETEDTPTGTITSSSVPQYLVNLPFSSMVNCSSSGCSRATNVIFSNFSQYTLVSLYGYPYTVKGASPNTLVPKEMFLLFITTSCKL